MRIIIIGYWLKKENVNSLGFFLYIFFGGLNVVFGGFMKRLVICDK